MNYPPFGPDDPAYGYPELGPDITSTTRFRGVDPAKFRGLWEAIMGQLGSVPSKMELPPSAKPKVTHKGAPIYGQGPIET